MSRILKAGGDQIDLAVASRRDEHDRAHDAVLRQSFDAGYEQGLAEGRARAEAEGAQAGVRAAQALERLAAAATAEDAKNAQDQRDDVLRSALEIAEWVLRSELSADGRALLKRLDAAMGSLLPDRETTVVVSAHDADLVRGWARNIRVDVDVDLSLPPGDAFVRTSHGGVDVSVTAALKLAGDVLGVTPKQAAA